MYCFKFTLLCENYLYKDVLCVLKNRKGYVKNVMMFFYWIVCAV